MNLYKGVIHVHTHYSYDGRHSIKEVAMYGKKKGYDFIGISDHSDTLDERMMSELVEECRNASNGCLMIPGIEFTCENRLHLIGLGIHSFIETSDTLRIAKFIRQQDGVSIIAHPVRYNYRIPRELARVVDGIEVWSAVYDGRYVPNHRSLKLLREVKVGNNSAIGFPGLDLHRIAINDHFNVEMTVKCERPDTRSIINALKNGNFSISNPLLSLDPRCNIGWLKLSQFKIARLAYNAAKGFKNSLEGFKNEKRTIIP